MSQRAGVRPHLRLLLGAVLRPITKSSLQLGGQWETDTGLEAIQEDQSRQQSLLFAIVDSRGALSGIHRLLARSGVRYRTLSEVL